MTRKPFEELTISDDFMFCKVMEHESLCKEFLEMLFSAKIEKITYLSSQNIITTNSGAKTVRLDILVKDDIGTSYDIEMCFSARRPCLSENTSFAIRQKHRCCLKPPPSMAVLIRRAFSAAARMPLVISEAIFRLLPKFAIKSVHGCTLLMM